jgi:hypothetical protein
MTFISILQFSIHYGLHFLVPGVIAWFFFRGFWKKTWLVMLCTMIVDLDHLLAIPIFDPNRCSIGSHSLHSEYAIYFYIIMLSFKKTRIIAIGLLLHIIADYQDCLW